MKKKISVSIDEVIESCSHMDFVAFILIDDRVVNFESISYQNNDLSNYLESVELLKRKFNSMYQDLLVYREKYKLETMCVSLEFKTTHSVNNTILK